MADKTHAGSRAKSVLGGKGKSKSKSSGKKPHRLSIRHGKSGGHIVTHHFEPDETGMTEPDEDHVLPDKESMLQHVSDNTPDTPAPQAPAPGGDGSAMSSTSIAPAPPAGM